MKDEEKTEYEGALAQYRHFASLRRQDMMFVTAVQGAVLAVIKENVFGLTIAHIPLTVAAILVTMLGLNSERRLSAYMCGYMRRAKNIEDKNEMSFLHEGTVEVNKRRFLFPNRVEFPIYYLSFMTAWIVIWIANAVA